MKGPEGQHEELDCGWWAEGSRGKFLSRRETGPIEDWWLETGQTMEGNSMSLGGSA